MNKLLLVIQGPTASGKTALGIKLAKHYKTVVFSADSRQFYKELSIGTAKPTLEEQDDVTHYFIHSHSIHDAITSATYVSEVVPKLNNEFLTKDIVVLVGGSGMYIDALCYGLDDLPVNPFVKNELIELLDKEGLQTLLEELEQKDPICFAKIDKNNSVRVIRALEVIRSSGKTYTSFLSNQKQSNHDFDILKVTIDLDREVLYQRINRRVDVMIENGLEEEAKSVQTFKHLQALQTVGYAEWYDFFEGKFSREETIDRIKQNTRRYAKRQLTWFRRDKSAIWLQSKEVEEQFNEVCNLVNNWTNEN